MKAVRWSVCFHLQRGIGAGFSLPGSSLRATNVAYSWSMRYHPKVLVQPKETVTVWLRTEFILPFARVSIDSCLNSICQNVTFFSIDFQSDARKRLVHVCFSWQLDLHPGCPNIFGSSGKQMVIASVFKPIFMQGKFGNGGMFHAESFFFLFFFFFYSWQKCLHRWDAVWVCLPLLWLLFVHEHASSAFFY